MIEILMAEDDMHLRKGLAESFREEGYFVRSVGNGLKAVQEFDRKQPDLVLLDLDMPIMNGVEACREIRKRDQLVPIMFLSGFCDTASHLAGLKVGADDYMDKDIAPEEMRLRIRRALIRAHKCEPSYQFRFGPATIDPEAFTLCVADGKSRRTSVRLTTREVEILRYLANNRGNAISWDALQTRFWGVDDDDSPDKLRQYIKRLRDKLGSAADHLQTIKGVGIIYE